MTDQNLTEYIQNALNHGLSKDQIYKDLLNQGWSLQAIDEHYHPVHSTLTSPDPRKKTSNIIVIFGAILVGLGVFSFVASNWQGLPSAAKVIIILLAMIFFYVLGWYLKEYLQYSRTGEACYLLGAILYGSGIYLVGQIFHIRVNWPDGMLLWLLGTVAMAYALDSYPLYFLSIPLGIVAIFGYPEFIFDIYGEDALIFTSSALLVITCVVTFWLGLYMRKKMPDELKRL